MKKFILYLGLNNKNTKKIDIKFYKKEVEKMEMLENKNNIVIVADYDYKTKRNIIDLWSYNSHIASFVNYENQNNCLLKLNRTKWNYSQATLKHLKHFINDYIEDDYYTTKQEFEQKIKKNGFIYLVNECDL